MEVVFYYRDGCHLCEEMAAVLHARWPQVFTDMAWVDVDSLSSLKQQYGNLVPVLLVDGVQIAHYFLDIGRATEYFGPPMIQV